MKPRKLAKLKYNIWFYLVLFSMVILIVTWVIQILLFDMIYQHRKFNSIKTTGDELSALLNTDAVIDETKVTEWLSRAVMANEAGIFTYLAYFDEGGNLKTDTIVSGYSNINVGQDTVERPIGKPNTDENDNSTDNKHTTNVSDRENILIIDAISVLEGSNSTYLCDRVRYENDDGYFYYITTIKNQTMDGYLILISSQQALNETIKIIQSQLVIVSGIIVVISFFFALYIATKLSKPIDKMSKTAKVWAMGEENVNFAGDEFEELKELADALNYAKDGISQTGVLQRDLLANVSHDLKTPLTMIKAYAEMIRDISGDVKEKRDKHTKVIIDEADRLTMLVNDILDLSKLQNGMYAPELVTVNLSELLETVLFRFNEFAKNTGYTIITEIEPNLITLCDKAEIEQVFYNLIGNSINYTGEDKTIKVRLLKKNNIILFETIDSGKGISQEKLTTIWEKYYRYSETHQRPIKGTGLGLSIVKTILEAHNLKFGVVSKKDVGSNFFIEFMVKDE